MFLSLSRTNKETSITKAWSKKEYEEWNKKLSEKIEKAELAALEVKCRMEDEPTQQKPEEPLQKPPKIFVGSRTQVIMHAALLFYVLSLFIDTGTSNSHNSQMSSGATRDTDQVLSSLLLSLRRKRMQYIKARDRNGGAW